MKKEEEWKNYKTWRKGRIPLIFVENQEMTPNANSLESVFSSSWRKAAKREKEREKSQERRCSPCRILLFLALPVKSMLPLCFCLSLPLSSLMQPEIKTVLQLSQHNVSLGFSCSCPLTLVRSRHERVECSETDKTIVWERRKEEAV